MSRSSANKAAAATESRSLRSNDDNINVDWKIFKKNNRVTQFAFLETTPSQKQGNIRLDELYTKHPKWHFLLRKEYDLFCRCPDCGDLTRVRPDPSKYATAEDWCKVNAPTLSDDRLPSKRCSICEKKEAPIGLRF